MPSTAIPHLAASGSTGSFEAAKARVHSAQRHLDGVEPETVIAASHVDGWILMTCEANETYLP